LWINPSTCLDASLGASGAISFWAVLFAASMALSIGDLEHAVTKKTATAVAAIRARIGLHDGTAAKHLRVVRPNPLTVPTSREMDHLMAAVKESWNEARDRCLVLLMFRHGLRVSEACGLQLD
jgi:integrase